MKSFAIEVWYGPQRASIVLSAANAAQAILLAKKIYPTARVVSAKELK